MSPRVFFLFSILLVPEMAFGGFFDFRGYEGLCPRYWTKYEGTGKDRKKIKVDRPEDEVDECIERQKRLDEEREKRREEAEKRRKEREKKRRAKVKALEKSFDRNKKALIDAADSSDVNGRLKLQYQVYDLTREHLEDLAGLEHLSKKDYLEFLSVPDRFKVDQGVVGRHHKKVIGQAREKAIRASSKVGIDLARIRGTDKVEQFCAELPKGGMLHVHPRGTVKPDTVRKILEDHNPRIWANDVRRHAEGLGRPKLDLGLQKGNERFNEMSKEHQDEYVSLFCFDESQSYVHDFDEMEEVFDILGVFGHPKQRKKHEPKPLDPGFTVYLDFLERAKAQGVRYVEFTRVYFADSRLNEKLTSLGEELEKRTGVKVRWNIAHKRNFGSSGFGRDMVDAFSEEDASPYLVGVDTLGNETEGSTSEIVIKSYARMGRYNDENGKSRDIGMTMHSGEFGDGYNPRNALIGGVHRMGHGIKLSNDPIGLEYARRRGVGIEANLQSNYILGAVDSYGEHPYLDFLRLGLPVSLSTDDEGIFATDMNRECEIAVNHTDVTWVELKQMMGNSIATSFADEGTKKELMGWLSGEMGKFERKWRGKTTGKARPASEPSRSERPKAFRYPKKKYPKSKPHYGGSRKGGTMTLGEAFQAIGNLF